MLCRASQMTPRAPGWTTKLRRLFWAAVQCLVVHSLLGLASPAVAHADEAPPPDQKAVGMCGTSAQSIAAPPPIYPGSDAVAAPCAPPTEQIQDGVPVLPTDRPAVTKVELEKSAVLPTLIPFPPRTASTSPASAGLRSPGEEHRARSKRPPRF
jgi:hypothetical protein